MYSDTLSRTRFSVFLRILFGVSSGSSRERLRVAVPAGPLDLGPVRRVEGGEEGGLERPGGLQEEPGTAPLWSSATPVDD